MIPKTTLQITHQTPLLLEHKPIANGGCHHDAANQDLLVNDQEKKPIKDKTPVHSTGGHSIAGALQVLSFPQAKEVTAKLGDHLDTLRVGLPTTAETDKSFETIAAGLFGPASASAPALPENALRWTSNWGNRAAYPQFVVDPKSGAIYMHASDRSDKWFGPHLPPKEARVIGTFTADQNLDLGVIASTHSFSTIS